MQRITRISCMIINQTYGLLFVHIQKTAGSSISDSLLRLKGSSRLGKTHSFITDYEVPDGLFKFAFVRNPWDRLVSWYNMLIKNDFLSNDFKDYILGNASSFSDFLDCTEIIIERRSGYVHDGVEYKKSIAYNQLDYMTGTDGKPAVDFIGKYESLQEDFDTVMDRIGIPRIDLKRINKFKRQHYRKYYTDADAEKVSILCKRDIEFFNYSF